jgi:hypothetical protein
MPRKKKQQNPHAELCAWANGLRPDSPRFDEPEDDAADALADDADREMFGDDADYGLDDIGNK